VKVFVVWSLVKSVDTKLAKGFVARKDSRSVKNIVANWAKAIADEN